MGEIQSWKQVKVTIAKMKSWWHTEIRILLITGGRTIMRRKEREVTDIAEIRAFLDECKVCRVGFFDGERPYIVPMNLAYELKEEKY